MAVAEEAKIACTASALARHVNVVLWDLFRALHLMF